MLLTCERQSSELSPVGGSKLRSYFSPFVDQSSPDYVSRRGRDRSLQCRFPIVDILFRSGDIRDGSAKSFEIVPKCEVVRNRAEKSRFLAPKFFWENPNFWTWFLKLHTFSIMQQSFVAIGRETAEISGWIKKRKETAAKHRCRVCVIAQRVALIIQICTAPCWRSFRGAGRRPDYSQLLVNDNLLVTNVTRSMQVSPSCKQKIKIRITTNWSPTRWDEEADS